MFKRVLCCCLLLFGDLHGVGSFKNGEKQKHIEEKFWNIDPYNLESLCAYYHLYRDQLSLQRLLQLFPSLQESEVLLFVRSILEKENKVLLEEEQSVIDKLSCEGLVLSLSDSSSSIDPEKDLGRALVFAEFSDAAEEKARYYGRVLDILALRIHVERLRALDREHYALGSKEYHKVTIEAMNRILFYEEGIRYPSKKEMFSDEFSFLSSVADRKFGVCLGVSSLYFALSQRVGVPLEAVTPPGHIYLRYLEGEVNIETTAGGRHLSTESYDNSLDPKKLRIRTPKEILGLTFMNQGSCALQKQKYAEAEASYEKALKYLEDEELKELLGFVRILQGKKKEGKHLLKHSPQAEVQGSMNYDYLHGNIDDKTLSLLFQDPGLTYQEITQYGEELKKAMKNSPKCCEGYRRLASIAFHLGKIAEGVALLERCVQDSPQDLVLHLKLCKILCERYDYAKALHYFLRARELAESQGVSQETLHSSMLYVEVLKKLNTVAP